jgi:hypothetical protein
MPIANILAQVSSLNLAQLNSQNHSSKVNNSSGEFSAYMSGLLKNGSTNMLAIAEGSTKSELEFLRNKEEEMDTDNGLRTVDDALADVKKVMRELFKEK